MVDAATAIRHPVGNRSGSAARDPRPAERRTRGDAEATTSVRRPDSSRRVAGARDAEDTQQVSTAERARRIDATLTRLTAAHAGVVLDRVAGDPGERPDGAARTTRGRRGNTATARARRRPPVARLLAVVAVVALVLLAGGGWASQRWLASGMQTVAALDPNSPTIIDPVAQQGAENILLVSTAAATDSTTSRGAGNVAVVHIPAGGGPVVVLTFPAQLELGRPTCAHEGTAGAGPDLVPAANRSSLTGALSLGGPRCLTQLVQQLTGLAVTRYVGLDLDAIGIAVDAVSGVPVCVPWPVVDARLGPVAPITGYHSLGGRAAADYVHAADVSGDPADGRGLVTRQQQVLAAVLGDTLSTPGLLDVSRVASVRATLGPALVTDQAGLDQVLALARSVSRPDSAGVTFRAVPSVPDASGSGVLPLTAEAKALFDAVRTGAALPAPTAAPTTAAPTDVHVDILNASSHAGQAARTGDILSGLGFRVGTVTNAAQPTPETLIRFSPDQTNAAALLGASVPAAAQVADPGAHGELQLVLGSSFDSVVRAPSTPTAPAPTQGADPATACT